MPHTNGDDCAYPSVTANGFEYGLTKREYFAAMAMQGLLAAPNLESEQSLAELAVEHADALLEELSR